GKCKFFYAFLKRKEVLNSMNKYNAKEQKKQDLLTKATKKKHRNQILTYLIKNLVSVATWENIRDCNTFMMLVSDQTMEKKKQQILIKKKKKKKNINIL